MSKRQHYTNPSAHVGRAVDQDPSTAFRHVLRALVDTDAHARRLGRLEWLEQSVPDELRCHADAAIRDFDHRGVVIAAQPDRYFALARGCIERILHQMTDDMLELIRVAHREDPGGQIHFDRRVLLATWPCRRRV